MKAYMVIDVTWAEYYGKVFTFENINLPDETLLKVIKAGKSTKEEFIAAYPDEDADEVAVFSNHPRFGFFMPVDYEDDMHASEGVYTTMELFEKYAQTMPIIAKALDK